MPTVSVAIPVFNGGRFLAEAVESVYAQTRSPDEVIVLDDGSTDETPDIVGELSAKYPLRQVRQPNAGEAVARNRCVELASGDLLAFLDQDDLWDPHKLERQVEHIESWDISFTDCIQQSHDGSSEIYQVRDWRWENALDRFSRAAVILTSSAVLARREMLVPFEHVEPFGTDWLMWLRLAEAGRRIGHLPEPLTIRRLHEANLSAGYDRYLESADAVLERLGNRRCSARWHLEAAIQAKERGERHRARRHIIAASRAWPMAIRPGWLRMLT
jgi:glycosyltransferase involved in cell wall biosynthesis